MKTIKFTYWQDEDYYLNQFCLLLPGHLAIQKAKPLFR